MMPARCCPLGLLLIVLGTIGGCGRLLLTVDDFAHVPGRPGLFVAQLEAETPFGVRDGVEDHTITFWLDDIRVGTARTDGEGRAELLVHNPLPPKATYCAATARIDQRELRDQRPVHAWTDGRVIIVVDVDDTLADTDYDDLLLDPIDTESRPYPGAADILQQLQQHYHVLYLTARPRFLLEKTRDWLRRHGFPRAPVMTAPTVSDVLKPETLKRRLLAQRRETWPNMLIGVGNQPTDTRAYVSVGMLSIFITDRVHAAAPNVITRSDWSMIRRLFERHAGTLRSPQRLRRLLQHGEGGSLATDAPNRQAAP